jgi:hypothetical protein
VLDDVEWIVSLISYDFDKRHAASTVPLRVEMRTPQMTSPVAVSKPSPTGSDLTQEQPTPED